MAKKKLIKKKNTKKKVLKKKVVLVKKSKASKANKKSVSLSNSLELLFKELDSKGLNFVKNLLFSNEVRRLCRFASSSFKEDPYNEIEKTISFINS